MMSGPEVGTCFKQQGQVCHCTGPSLVGGAVRAERLEGWLAQLRRQPDAVLYCFRACARKRCSMAA